MAQRQVVLLVEDDPEVLAALTKVLTLEDYEVLPASSRLEAVSTFQQSRIDIVLLDLNLNGENGWGVFDELRGLRPGLPIIVITAQPERLGRQSSSHASEVLEKPFDPP